MFVLPRKNPRLVLRALLSTIMAASWCSSSISAAEPPQEADPDHLPSFDEDSSFNPDRVEVREFYERLIGENARLFNAQPGFEIDCGCRNMDRVAVLDDGLEYDQLGLKVRRWDFSDTQSSSCSWIFIGPNPRTGGLCVRQDIMNVCPSR